MSAGGSWFHSSMKTVSRSAGRSVVAAAAYRTGERLQDERYAQTHDYTRRRGVEAHYTVAPECSPAWATDLEALWNGAEAAEKRINSTVAREQELALPAFVTPEARRRVTDGIADYLVERYGVAVTVAIHEPGRHGDERNYHAHILFTTREMTPEGLGKKTRILDDRKTGPKEIIKLRELAADLINEELRAVNSDIRVDHRSFAERGIEQVPETHLGPTQSEMERRGEPTERGDRNREAQQVNAMIAERNALDAAIAQEEECLGEPPKTREEAMEKVRAAENPEAIREQPRTDPQELPAPAQTPQESRERIEQQAQPFADSIRSNGAIAATGPSLENDGLTWWQRAGMRLAVKARDMALSFWKMKNIFTRLLDRDKGLDL